MSTGENLQLKATIEVEKGSNIYKIVDFLNKNLKEKHLIFGLSQKSDETMVISIYET